MSAQRLPGSVKPKFPPTRIKKIMQADEDVGKMTQVIPLVVSRAVELFVADLIKDLCQEASWQGARRVGLAHFQTLLEKKAQYDFLEDRIAVACKSVKDVPDDAS